MARRIVVVTGEQVEAAQALVRIQERHGDPVDRLVRMIAEAQPREAAPPPPASD